MSPRNLLAGKKRTTDGAPFSCHHPEPLTLARQDQASVGPKQIGKNFLRDVPEKEDVIAHLMKAAAQRQ